MDVKPGKPEVKPGKSDVNPRKAPRQARAKDTVDAIVEATIQVLLEETYGRFTTVRVAERAGVSIGTLYQYYPNKAALAVAVIDRCCEEFLTAFESALDNRRCASLDDCIRALIDMAFVSHHLPPDRHRCVLELAPRLGVADRTEVVGQMAAKAVESALRRHTDEIAPEIDLATAANMIETTLEALAHRAVLVDSAQEQNEALARETRRLISQYLAVGRRASD
jgi:AcrR family transcriptional regulator